MSHGRATREGKPVENSAGVTSRHGTGTTAMPRSVRAGFGRIRVRHDHFAFATSTA
jgi:hypothetical protein